MRERDRLALREWREEYAREEAAEREKQERPIREAEEQLQNTQRELRRIERERITGVVEDPDLKKRLKGKAFLDPDLFEDERVREYYKEIENDPNFARDFNSYSIQIYRERNPKIYWSDELVQQLGSYFDRHGIALTSVPMIEAAVNRILACGLAPTEPPPPPPALEPVWSVEPEQPREPEFQTGWDHETGQKRNYSNYEISKMSADEYIRCFRIRRAEMLDSMREW